MGGLNPKKFMVKTTFNLTAQKRVIMKRYVITILQFVFVFSGISFLFISLGFFVQGVRLASLLPLILGIFFLFLANFPFLIRGLFK